MQAIEGKMIGSSIRFVVVDLDNDRHAWQHYGVEALPHVAMFSAGTPIRYSGDLQLDDIEVWIKAKVGKRPVHIGCRFGCEV
jgi:thioredoxin-like negative regulator of GroEL